MLRIIEAVSYTHLDVYKRQASDYGNLGNVYQTRGELDQAVEYYLKALDLNEVLGRKQNMANDYDNLGVVYQIRGELDQAVEYYQKSLILNQKLGRKEGMAIQFANLGLVHRVQNDLDKAIEYWQKAVSYTHLARRLRCNEIF